jgi:hypothetical protein
MLFAADWMWPTEPKPPSAHAASVESPVEQTIRIQSARHWPKKIVFDTSQPTIVPPPSAAVAIPPPPAPVVAANSPLDARAEVKPAAPPKRQAKARHRNSRPASYRPEGWSDPWRGPARDPWRHTYASAGPMAPSWSFGRW